ncbi:putative hydroquinone glucosyltransferase [Medicago truncatula]|uniref:Glycosyltransferase n=2 Tax=Medicago truncatula TaxID=3880 RepID=A0A072TFX3_MEDTR|nr:hydroquinone glucosyltransferase [Medicago truncatula]KEH16439.1 UDP-glucosyltransferase family protein [Medicago truncatula]RHN45538.1 putative hydroquinone glucosyltransferase [Medicago truncatula]
MAKTIHIAAISIPAFSHQASIIEFCKKLIHHHNHFHITIIFPTIDSPLQATLTLLKSLPSNITYTFLPPINKKSLPQNLSPAVQIQLAVSQSMPSFHTTISSLCSSSTTPPLVALITDPFANESLEVLKEFNLLSYIYFPPSAMTLSLFIHFPKLHEEISCEFRDHNEAIQIPGCVPIHGIDLPEHFQDRSSLAYDLILQRCKRFNLADGFLVNSFLKMEENTMKALEEHNDSVFLVGPIIQNGTSNETKVSDSDLECLKWLKNQSTNSVLFVSFGSGGTLSQEQVNELAFGLELSGQKFLWVLRVPSDSSNEAYLGAKNDDDPLNFLPKGFLERTKGQGLVVPNWAPQTQILSHGSIGAFLTHCGWNSVLESVVLGVPMIAWPLFAEQKINAVLLCDGVKVAMRLKFNEDGLVGRDEIAKVVKELMLDDEGNVIRERIEELRDAAIDALKEDGSSTLAICQFGNRLESNGTNL